LHAGALHQQQQRKSGSRAAGGGAQKLGSHKLEPHQALALAELERLLGNSGDAGALVQQVIAHGQRRGTGPPQPLPNGTAPGAAAAGGSGAAPAVTAAALASTVSAATGVAGGTGQWSAAQQPTRRPAEAAGAAHRTGGQAAAPHFASGGMASIAEAAARAASQRTQRHGGAPLLGSPARTPVEQHHAFSPERPPLSGGSSSAPSAAASPAGAPNPHGGASAPAAAPGSGARLAPLQLPGLQPGLAASSPADPDLATGSGHSPAGSAPLSAAAVYMPDWVPEDKRQQVVEALAAFYSHDGAPQEFDPVADMQRAISYFAPAWL
jgi:hypothetical protein